MVPRLSDTPTLHSSSTQILHKSAYPPSQRSSSRLTLSTHRTQPLRRILLDPCKEAMLSPTLYQHLTHSRPSYSMSSLIPYETNVRKCQSLNHTPCSATQSFNNTRGIDIARKAYTARSHRLDIYMSDMYRRIGRDRCRRRHLRACPSARTRRRSIR